MRRQRNIDVGLCLIVREKSKAHEYMKDNYFIRIKKSLNVRSVIIGLVTIVVAFVLGNLAGNLVLSQREKIASWPIFQKKTTAPPQGSSTASPSAALKPLEITLGGKKMTAPLDSAPESEKSSFSEAIKAMSVQTNQVSLGAKCVLTPQVVTVPAGASLTITNADTEKHTLEISSETIVLEKGEKKDVPTTFKQGDGLYGIACDREPMKGFVEVKGK